MRSIKTILCFLFIFSAFYCYPQNSYQKTGTASFYADKFNGRRTSSGEIFSQKKMTCAHRTLPLGTKLKVTNLANDKSVVLLVNDRGPFHEERIIDVTMAAAKKLDFVKSGEADVRIEVLNNESAKDSLYVTSDTLRPFFKMEPVSDGLKGYSVKVATYLSEEKMMEVVKDLQQDITKEVYVQPIWHHKHFMYRIYAGKFESKNKAEDLKRKLDDRFSDCYVVELIKEEKRSGALTKE